MTRASTIAVAAALTGCAATPTPESAVYDRVCSAVVAAYKNGVRPSQIEIEVPGPGPSDPAARMVLVTPHVPLAEQCLGLPMPSALTLMPPATQAPTPTTPKGPGTEGGVSPLDTRN